MSRAFASVIAASLEIFANNKNASMPVPLSAVLPGRSVSMDVVSNLAELLESDALKGKTY